MSERTQIDSEKFALNFASSNYEKGLNKKELIKESKDYLISYLTAYYLAQDFNNAEKKSFDNDGIKFQDLSFEELKNRVRDLNKY
ncbi:hypothetical protein M5C72_01290 [Companilactobacillus allii]|uniref:Uncharacterized protein n=1 Tax=Companilactobacillus allii TaxID=1847728 RepID=A0A1P8Q1Z9_9LACO|nr:hypothetical protein [Companilactobacillus allii]APX71809.1 hypothetical protein BTM29_04225 [Companilactobacillus allii]USQ68896.1 hypothetical protein M5C72_01290 [Companilactobacillus allii]